MAVPVVAVNGSGNRLMVPAAGGNAFASSAAGGNSARLGGGSSDRLLDPAVVEALQVVFSKQGSYVQVGESRAGTGFFQGISTGS